MNHMTLSIVTLLPVVALYACGGTGDADVFDLPGGDSISDVFSTDEVIVPPDVRDSKEDMQNDPGEDKPKASCHVQPCPFRDMSCRDEKFYNGTTYVDNEDPSCPGNCVVSELMACPEGTYCYSDGEYWSEYWGIHGWEAPREPCYPINCNEDENLFCQAGEFCDTYPGTCGGPGVCVNVLHPAHLTGAENEWRHICGCDNKTYDNWKDRVHSSVSVKGAGPCCDPTLLSLSEPNEDGHRLFVVCATAELDSLIDNLPEEMKAVLDSAVRGTDGTLVGCDSGDVSFVGNLETDEDGSIDDEMFDALCRMAFYPGITDISGRPQNFCEQVGYSPEIRCGDECVSSCGCLKCEIGVSRCRPDARAFETCTEDGCWGDLTGCLFNATCVEDEHGASCRPFE